MSWSKEFPKKSGTYWFYGYRYGKVRLGNDLAPEYMLVTTRKTGDGKMMCVANGQFMYEEEIEEAYFMKCEFPEPPELE